MLILNKAARFKLREEMALRFLAVVKATADHSRVSKMAQIKQHGGTSCLLHSVAVAYLSVKLILFFQIISNLRFKEEELVRGALLHDYFLYDWHDHAEETKWHGFRHPQSALLNANEDFLLSEIEQDVIVKHMFPLTPRPPHCKEAVIVCISDKLCAIYECFARKKPYPNRHIRFALKFCTAE